MLTQHTQPFYGTTKLNTGPSPLGGWGMGTRLHDGHWPGHVRSRGGTLDKPEGLVIFPLTGEFYSAWQPLRLSNKERQHVVQEDCEVRNRCQERCRSPRRTKGGSPFQGKISYYTTIFKFWRNRVLRECPRFFAGAPFGTVTGPATCAHVVPHVINRRVS